MEPKTRHGYLVLADISGFVPYLAGVELDHANEILGELLKLIVHHFKPMLTPTHLEGGAVFAHAPEASVTRGETLLELFETTYAAFRDRLAAIRRRTTCTCRACRAVPMLDLKFLVHHGDYVVQRVAGHDELVGLDVNLVRDRLLKHPVSEATGWRAYALFTDTCLAHLGLQPESLRAHVQTESYEHVGEVRTYSLDLQAQYAQLIAARRIALSDAEADCTFTYPVSAQPAIVWAWLNDPDKRTQWQPGRKWSVGVRPQGRTAPGANNHCVHGAGTLLETVLDWRPFDYFTVELSQPPASIIHTVRLEPLSDGSGTRLHSYFKLRTRLPGWLARRLCNLMIARGFKLGQGWQKMAELIAQETAREAARAN